MDATSIYILTSPSEKCDGTRFTKQWLHKCNIIDQGWPDFFFSRTKFKDSPFDT